MTVNCHFMRIGRKIFSSLRDGPFEFLGGGGGGGGGGAGSGGLGYFW